MNSRRGHKALALKVGDRFFCRIGDKGQVLTAWHLAGAKLFMSRNDAIPTMATLAKKKKTFEIVDVEVTV